MFWKNTVLWEKDSGGTEPDPTTEEPTASQTEPTEPIKEPTEDKTPAPVPDYRDKIIARLTGRKNNLAEENAELKRQLEEAKAGKAAPVIDSGEIDKLAAEKASTLVLNRRADEEAARGRTLFPDFTDKVNALAGIVDFKDPQGQATYSKFLEIALETGKAAEIVHALGSNLEEADRILSMSPVKMAMALAKMTAEDKTKEPKTPTNVEPLPKPLTPIGSKKGPHSNIAPDSEEGGKLELAEWMRRRNAQVAEKKKIGGRR